jgi:mono/diheme cytochrome c family protein
MQVKVVIGTVAFMLTMIILGFATLMEPARMERYTLAYDGRRIEQGAEVYKSNCASCHGTDGTAQTCVDPANGQEIGCVGRPLNVVELQCGIPTQRMVQMGWLGTKHDFIESTIAVGRPWAGMPTWSQTFGGPLQQNQVENVALFVSNWESIELCAGPPPEAVVWPEDVEEVLAAHDGDAAAGAALYTGLACNACHGNISPPSAAAVGPQLDRIGSAAAQRVAGQSAAQYIYESILYPDAYIAPDCPNGPCAVPSSMLPTFGQRMNTQEMADLLAFLLAQE